MPVAFSDIQLRVPLWHESFPFVIMWSEKSNCTAVAKWFFFQLGMLEEALAYSSWIHDYEIQVYKTDEYMEKCREAVESGIPIIKFVRNPYARAFSGYLELCRSRDDEPGHWSIPMRREVMRHLMGVDTELEYTFSFHQYLVWLKTKDSASLDLHLAPQFRAFESGLSIEPFHVEQGVEGFARLEQRFALRPSDCNSVIFESDHYHRKVRSNDRVSTAMCHVGIPLQRSEDFVLFEPNISAVARDAAGDLVRQIFELDFTEYGYDLFPSGSQQDEGQESNVEETPLPTLE